ncbi:hypothetical protein B0H14DRAFT_2593766 [Mycena olivaceomarginata]|nr:hypothetical protein B0H14DRAFT_2593766 [Mycena olivaceomarginata]
MEYVFPFARILPSLLMACSEFPGSEFLFSCMGPSGAVLALPHGAYLEKLEYVEHAGRYAVRNAESWYKYINETRGGGLTNGSLYLITGCEKSRSGGMASFQNVLLGAEFQLSFRLTTNADTGYKGTPVKTKHFDEAEQHDEGLLNHTTFLHGFSISLSKGIWGRLFGKVTVSEIGGQSTSSEKSGEHTDPSVTAAFVEHETLGNDSSLAKAPTVFIYRQPLKGWLIGWHYFTCAPPLCPPILPTDGELSGFPFSYHFGGDVCAQLEEQYPEGVAVQHTDGRSTSPIAVGGFDMSEDTLPHEETSSSGARCTSACGSLLPIDEETRPATPLCSMVFMSVPSTPSNSSQMSFASVGSAGSFSGSGFAAATFDTTPTPLDSGMSLLPRIVIDLPIVRASPPDHAASADAENKGSFDKLDTGNAGDVNGLSVGVEVEDVDIE